MLKLLDGSTQTLDYAAMHIASPSLYFAALGRCTGVRRLELGAATDAHLVEATRLAHALVSISFSVATSKVTTNKKNVVVFPLALSENPLSSVPVDETVETPSRVLFSFFVSRSN